MEEKSPGKDDGSGALTVGAGCMEDALVDLLQDVWQE